MLQVLHARDYSLVNAFGRAAGRCLPLLLLISLPITADAQTRLPSPTGPSQTDEAASPAETVPPAESGSPEPVADHPFALPATEPSMQLPPAWQGLDHQPNDPPGTKPIDPSGTKPISAERGTENEPSPSATLEFPADEIELSPLIAIDGFVEADDVLGTQLASPRVDNAFGAFSNESLARSVRTIPSYVSSGHSSNRIVRYEVPLTDETWHEVFHQRGVSGELIEVTDRSAQSKSITARLKSFWRPNAAHQKAKKIRMVRYEVPAEDIAFHSQLSSLDGEILQPGMLRMPEVRFFQPKARVFMDLKRENDDEFDLFNDGAILASLDVIELYFPMPLISDRFAEVFGRQGSLASLGWRVGGTVGLGITTALNNGTTDNGSAPVSTLSTGIRYEFPLGRPSRELLETGDTRLDQRTRVGMEFGFQGGVSTRESLGDATDVGLYFGILVNTPWGG